MTTKPIAMSEALSGAPPGATPGAPPMTSPAGRFGGAAISLLDQCIVSAVNFLIIVILARSLAPTAFGVFMVAQLILVLLTSLQAALVTQPHNILGAQRDGLDYTRLTAVLGILQLSLSLSIAGIAALVGVAFMRNGNSDYAQLAFALAVSAPFWMTQEFVRRTFYTRNAVRRAAIIDAICYGLQLTGIVVVANQVGGIAATPANAMLALGAASFAALLFGLWHLRGDLAPRTLALLPECRSMRAFLASVRDTWRLSKWLVAQQVVTWFGANGHGWILAALLGPASFGLYRAAYQVVNILNPLRQAAMNHLPSRAARAFATSGRVGLDKWIRSIALILGAPFALAALLVAIGAEPIAALFYGREMELPHLHAIAALGALAYAINFARTSLDYGVLVAGGGRQIFIRSVWLMAFVCTAGVALVWSMGVVGAMISEVASAVLATALTLRIYFVVRRSNLATESPSQSRIRSASLAERTPPLTGATVAGGGLS